MSGLGSRGADVRDSTLRGQLSGGGGGANVVRGFITVLAVFIDCAPPPPPLAVTTFVICSVKPCSQSHSSHYMN